MDREDVPENGYVYNLPYKDGMADEYFSTRWFVDRYKELSGKKVPGVKDLTELVNDDIMARDLFEEFGYSLGIFLSPWLRAFKAEALVAGGNISKAWPLFGDSFQRALENENINITTAVSELKEHAALLGSAQLLADTYWNKMKEVVKLM
jgi:glucokinase